MDKLLITPVDNTDIDGFINDSFEKGYSEYNRLFIPNQGIDEDGNIIHYLPYGAISINDKLAIERENIFLINGYLNKPGVIVEKHYISKEVDGFILGDEKYFRVIDSNIDVPVNSLIIIMANQCDRFNLNKRELFYVRPESILIYLTPEGINPGPNNLLIKDFQDDLLGLSAYDQNKGTVGDNTYHYSDALYDMIIHNEKYSVVSKRDVKLVL